MISLIKRHAVLLTVILAGLVQLAYLYETRERPAHTLPLIDASTYHRQAMGMAQGIEPPPRPYWQPPLYPVLLSNVYGEGATGVRSSEQLDGLIWKARLLQVVLVVVAVGLTVGIGSRVAGRSTGLIAGLMLAFYGPIVFFSGQLLPVALATSLVLLAIWLTLIAIDRGGSVWWLAAGLALGLSVVTIPNSIFFVGIVGAWQWIKAKEVGNGHHR